MLEEKTAYRGRVSTTDRKNEKGREDADMLLVSKAWMLAKLGGLGLPSQPIGQQWYFVIMAATFWCNPSE
jgi:hypothetical protein